MKQIPLAAFLALTVVIFLYAGAHSQEDMTVVDNSLFKNSRRPPSVFPHDAHNEKAGIEECSECHHVYDEEGNRVEDESSEDDRCGECHNMEKDGRKPGLMEAFHTNCKGCHLKKKKGPVMCGECHVK
jgi:hypothetical protein